MKVLSILNIYFSLRTTTGKKGVNPYIIYLLVIEGLILRAGLCLRLLALMNALAGCRTLLLTADQLWRWPENAAHKSSTANDHHTRHHQQTSDAPSSTGLLLKPSDVIGSVGGEGHDGGHKGDSSEETTRHLAVSFCSFVCDARRGEVEGHERGVEIAGTHSKGCGDGLRLLLVVRGGGLVGKSTVKGKRLTLEEINRRAETIDRSQSVQTHIDQ